MKQQPNPEKIDKDNPEWSEAEIHQAVPFSALPESLRAKLGVRGAQKTPTKERITIRLSRAVVEQFRASGDGWQARVDAVLRDWLKNQSPAR